MKAYTPSELRALAGSQRTNPFFVTQVAAALNYAADAIEAADKALQAELARSQQSQSPEMEKAVGNLIEATEDLMRWQIKNAKTSHNSAYDTAAMRLQQIRAINPTGGTTP